MVCVCAPPHQSTDPSMGQKAPTTATAPPLQCEVGASNPGIQ